MPWQRKPPDPAMKLSIDRTQASLLIHMGQAWRAHQDGDPLRAIHHLRRAVEAIMVLIEQWSSEPGGGDDYEG